MSKFHSTAISVLTSWAAFLSVGLCCRTAGRAAARPYQAKCIRRTEAGFSLIEIMIAILILGIALVGMTQGVTVALTSSKEGELMTSAVLIAAAKIETIRAEGYILEGTDDGDLSGELSLFRWEEEITETDLDGLFEVVISIRNSGTGELFYELQTLLFDPPLFSENSVDETMTTRERLRQRSQQ